MIKYTLAGVLSLTLIALVNLSVGAEPVRALILTGQNNHDWKETTPVLRQILEQSGRFTVEVSERPETMTPESVSNFGVIISNWNSWGEVPVKEWPEAARTALIAFVQKGKGFVSVHAGSSSFYEWPDYQELVITAWKLDETGHGRQHAFRVTPTTVEHPITRGVTPFTIFDELWHRVPVQPGAQILATAYSAKENGGTDQDEPVVMVRKFGEGRSVNILLGHHARAMSHPPFGILLARSAEWAATEAVTLPAQMNESSLEKSSKTEAQHGEDKK